MKHIYITTIFLINIFTTIFGQNINSDEDSLFIIIEIDSTCIKNSLNCPEYNDKIFFDYIDTLQHYLLSEVKFKIYNAINYEKGIESKEIIYGYNIGIDDSYYPNKNNYKLENPLVFNRIECPYFDMETQYFYTEKDESIKVIFMEWNEYNNVNTLAEDKNYIKSRVKVFKKKFLKIKNVITHHIGHPTEINLNQTNNINGSMDEFIWKNTKGLNMNLELLCNKSFSRIRLIIYND